MRKNRQICAGKKNVDEIESIVFIFILSSAIWKCLNRIKETRKICVRFRDVIRYNQQLCVCDLFTLFFYHREYERKKSGNMIRCRARLIHIIQAVSLLLHSQLHFKASMKEKPSILCCAQWWNIANNILNTHGYLSFRESCFVLWFKIVT